MLDKYEGEKTIFQTLTYLEESTDDHLYLWKWKEGVIRFAGDISEDVPLEKRENREYSVEEWMEIVYDPDRVNMQRALDDICQGRKKTLNSEHRLMDGKGNTIWVSSRGKVMQEGVVVGRLSRSSLIHQIDSMTGLMNSSQMYIDLNKALFGGKHGYLVVFGVDDFKHINTSYGRSYGNQVLQRIGRILEECMKEHSRIYRLDGDHFAAKLSGWKKEQVEEVFKRVQEKMPLHCTISAGAVAYPMKEQVDSGTLFQYGEVSLDQAKKEGKNKLVFFSAVDFEKHLYTIDLTEEIRGSIKNDFQGFEIYYQPQISADGYRVCGAEALLRYHSFYNGMVSPVTFIPILEQTGMILSVGKWLLRSCFRQCKKWREYQSDFVMSINLSYLQLEDQTLGKYIFEELEAAELPGNAIMLELTESMQLQDFASFNQLFYELGKRGLRISIDDFGTGYSSLGYLRSLEVDEIKIDRCFVSRIQSSAYNYQLIKNIMELAFSTHIQVCCEGVETEEELSVLESLHPEKIQGFLFGRPLPVVQFEEMFLKNTDKNTEETNRRNHLYIEMNSSEDALASYREITEEKNAILNELEEIVYVSDPQTYEMYYLNPTGRRLTGIYDYEGKKCYSVLRGEEKPCSCCTNYLLNENVFYKWIDNNEHLKCRALMKDKLMKWRGKNARLGMCIKLSEQQMRWDEKTIGFQLLKAITLYHEHYDFNQGIEKVISFVGDFYKAERSYIYFYSPAEKVWKSVYEWCEPEAQGKASHWKEVRNTWVSHWISRLRRGESILVKNVDALRESEPEEWEMLKRGRIQKLMVCPMVYNGRLFGVMGIQNARNQLFEEFLLQQLAQYLTPEFVRRGFYAAIQEEEPCEVMNLIQERGILNLTQLGLWIIKIDSKTGKNRMYVDNCMRRLLGIERELTAEECYEQWYNRINDGYYKYIRTNVERMMEGKEVISLEYTWDHPTIGEAPVRCVGKLSSVEDGVYVLKGYHRMLSDVQQAHFLDNEDAPETFEFNEKKQMIYFHTGRNLIDGREVREENFPHSWVRQEIVHPYFAEEFTQMFTNVKDREESQSKDILLRNKEKEYAWYHMETHHLGEGEKDIHTLFVILHPIMEKRKAQMQYVRKDDFYRVMLSETIAFAEVDMETGWIQNGGGLWEHYGQEAEENNLTSEQVFLRHAQQVVDEVDMETCCYHLSAQNIRQRYLAGEETLHYDFRRKMAQGEWQWVQLVIHVFQEKISKNMYALLYLKNIDSSKRREIEQRKAASCDPLTNLLNCRIFKMRVENYMQTAAKEEVSALMVLDLDNFKQINDNYGHQAGDRILINLARVLRKTFRKTDLIGRLGGDEFLIFMKNMASRDILNKRLEKLQSSLGEDEENRTFCSIGIELVESGAFDYETALKHADQALYTSKRSGKNSFSYYDECSTK